MEGLARTLAQHGSGIAQAISCCYHIMSVFISYEYGFLFFFGPSRSQLVPAGLMTELDSEAGLIDKVPAILLYVFKPGQQQAHLLVHQ